MSEAQIETLPGTEFKYIANDTAHGVAARELGTIITELALLSVPELLEVANPGAHVVDVGAFVGDTARWFLDRGCKVTAFEAFKDAFECLKHNCPEADCHWQIVGGGGHVALRDQFDTLYPQHNGNHGTRGVAHGEHGDRRACELDKIIKHPVDLLKVDVEGYECQVLFGAHDTIIRDRPVILIEVFDSMLRRFNFVDDDILRLLPFGYRHKVVVGTDADDRRDWLCWPAEKFPHWK